MENHKQVLSDHQHPDFLELLEYFSRKSRLKAKVLESFEYVHLENTWTGDFLSCELVGEEKRTKRSRKKRPFSVSALSQLSLLPTSLS